jgi:ATP-binding cassette subfamily B protein
MIQEASGTKARPKDPSRTEQALRAFHDEGVLGKAYDLRLVSRLWPFIRPYQRMLWMSIGLGVVTAGMSLLRPFLMRYAIDRGAMARDPHALFLGGVGFAVVIVGEQLINFIQVYAVQISGARATSDLRRDVFAFCTGESWRSSTASPSDGSSHA